MDLRVVYAWLVMNRQGLTKTLVIMNLTAILLLATALQVSAAGYGQSVTLNTKDAPLQNVFQQIEKQTGYQFFYKEKAVQDKRPVTVQLNNVPLNQALNSILVDQDLSFSIVDKVIVIKQVEKKNDFILSPSNNLPPPPIDVHGKIVNEKGEPVLVTVTVKGTKIQTTTNANGIFELKEILGNSTLVFTGVNVETTEWTIPKENVGNVNIELSVKTKVTTGEAVVVEVNTGFQKLKPNEVNSSYVVIDNKKFNEQVGTTVLQRLDGITSGLLFNIDKSASNTGVPRKTPISIRGISTINGNLDPLVVLDNFIYDGDINNINPNDVENVTILKDAAATSIYGSQGGNGVIVITTKRGKFNQKLKINFSSNLSIVQKDDLYSLPNMAVGDFINVEELLFNKGYFDNTIFTYSPEIALTPAVEIFLKRKNGIISASDSTTQIENLKRLDVRDDYNKYFNKRGYTQQYSLNLSGGNNTISWLISGSYDKSNSKANEKTDRINVRFANTYKPSKNLLVNIDAYYTNFETGGNVMPQYSPKDGIGINGRQVPYLRFADENGPLPVDLLYRRSYIDTLGGGNLLDWKYYPLEEYKHNIKSNKREDITANFSMNYQVLKSLNINVDYQYQKENSYSKNYSDIQSYEARNIINTFAQIIRDGNGNVINVLHDYLPVGGILTLGNTTEYSQNFRTQVNFKNTWRQHFVSAIAGVQIRETVNDGGITSTTYGYNEDPASSGRVDFVNSYPTVFGYTAGIFGSPSVGSKKTYRFISEYANASYFYRQRYSFTISGRRDGANIFGATSNDKWKPLWSAGLGWEISKETFYKLSRIPFLKFRATIGYSGNVDLRKTAYPIATYYSQDPNTGFPYASVSINDPSLRWEKSRIINLGIDFAFSKQIITGSVEYYQRRVKDLYGLSQLDYTTGYGNTITKNVANMMGKGVDIQLNSKNINRALKWETRILFNYSVDKVTNYYNPSPQPISDLLSSGAGSQIIPVVGIPVYGIAAYKWGGLNNNGDPQGFLNGQLSTDYTAIFEEGGSKGLDGNIVYVGHATPPIWGSLSNQIDWKNFSFSFNISYKFGYYFRKPTIDYNALFTKGIGNIDFEKRWQQPGDEFHTNIPSLVYFDYPQFEQRNNFFQFSEINVLKADNIRLQYINISYAFKNKQTNFCLTSFSYT